ncbi:MAG: adenine phosphoribosyltransferase [Actinomycetota bacterium]|jgi:adenine phosphoribosyltransferase|nr:adenine phosphoribosyltransferase [Actinomycetota bacterium]
MEQGVALVKDLIRDVPDFPRPGVVFKDITPLLADPAGFSYCVEALARRFAGEGVAKVLGVEARGFIIAAPIAYHLGAGFVPVRKKGKLPGDVYSYTYELEYGTDTLEVRKDAISPGEKVLVVDDVLATGGTASATARLVEQLGARPVGFGCVLELSFLAGREKLAGIEVEALVKV